MASLSPRDSDLPGPGIDLDDVSHCPLGVRCEIDGSERPDLVVDTFDTPVGVLCLSICPDHVAPKMSPPVSVATAFRLVGQHCAHLGIDVDQAAAAWRARTR